MAETAVTVATGARARRRRLGQYFTPAQIARFVIATLQRLAKLPPRPLVIDPACGDGAFLREALGCGLTSPGRLFGCDIDPAVAAAWRTNGLARLAHLHCADGLVDHLGAGIGPGRFDVVVGNPPFGFAGRGRPRKEIAFLRRFVELSVPSGHIAVILPEGIFANARMRNLRDELLERVVPRAVIELPAGAFRRERTAARAAVLFARRAEGRGDAPVLVGRIGPSWSGHSDDAIAESTTVPIGRLRGERWDARWWLWPKRDRLDRCRWPVRRLGEFIEHITYGPILPGRRPRRGGVVVINQKQLGPTGLVLTGALRVAAGSAFDPPRCRVRRGDLLMARCGAGSLPQVKLAVVERRFVGTVSCFVDILRLRGIEPRYVAAFLKGRYGRGQILRVLNGVGTPNISFGEIRALRVPVPPRRVQARAADLWRAMTRAHRAGRIERARELLREAIAAVERCIESGA